MLYASINSMSFLHGVANYLTGKVKLPCINDLWLSESDIFLLRKDFPCFPFYRTSATPHLKRGTLLVFGVPTESISKKSKNSKKSHESHQKSLIWIDQLPDQISDTIVFAVVSKEPYLNIPIVEPIKVIDIPQFLLNYISTGYFQRLSDHLLFSALLAVSPLNRLNVVDDPLLRQLASHDFVKVPSTFIVEHIHRPGEQLVYGRSDDVGPSGFATKFRLQVCFLFHFSFIA